ncbi:MAG TPA: PEGA domain-containing protein, partial [Pseudomonadota bacterium]|nr:PEGA domain-containing protein [Pseudomonadota bacterium]
MQVGSPWRAGLGIFFWLLGALDSGEALARPPAPGHAALVQRGEAALRAGELAAAEQALTAAYLQAPHAELLFLLGRLALAQQQLLTAQDLMRRYLNDPTATPDPEKTAEAQRVLSQLRPPSGKVRVQGDPGGFVLLDGRLLGRLPLVQPLLAAPGAHTVAIKYPGKLLDAPPEVAAGRMVDIQCTRATGAVFLATLPSLLVVLAAEPSSPMVFEQLLDAVERAAHGQQLTVLKPEALIPLAPDLKELPFQKALAELKRCLAQPDCLPRMLHLAKLEHALRVSVQQTAPPPPAEGPPAAGDRPVGTPDSPPLRWEFALELVHADVFAAASARTRSCSPCQEQPAIAALQEVTSQTLAAGLGRPRGTFAVSSEPAGAEVRVGDRLLGQTPLALAAWTGEYALELQKPGRQPVRQMVRVESGQT